MTAKLFRAVGFRVDIEEVMHPDGRVVIFNIPGRPRGTAYAHEGAYLMRVGEELHPMTEDQLRNIFAEGQPDWLERAAESGLTGQKLESERLIESKENGFDVLNIGAVLLAKDMRTFASVFRKAARVVLYKTHSKLETISDLTGNKGYAVGFRGLIRYIMTQLPQNEVIVDALRKESKLVPEVVIRDS